MLSYYTVKGESQSKLEMSRSLFICRAKGVESFEEGMEYIKEISSKHSDATHNCYAIRTIDNRQKFSDDGEPQGTAGQPILQALKNKNLHNTAVIVTRYFGGIKLGASGLASAYAQSAANALNQAQIAEMRLCFKARIDMEYAQLPKLLQRFRDDKIILLDTQYTDSVTIEFACPVEDREKIESFLLSLTAGKSQIEWKQKQYYLYNSLND